MAALGVGSAAFVAGDEFGASSTASQGSPTEVRVATLEEIRAMRKVAARSGFGSDPDTPPTNDYGRSTCYSGKVTGDGKYAALTASACPGAKMAVQGGVAALEQSAAGSWLLHHGYEDATTGFDIPSPWCHTLKLGSCA